MPKKGFVSITITAKAGKILKRKARRRSRSDCYTASRAIELLDEELI